jgi:hypothetical protein
VTSLSPWSPLVTTLLAAWLTLYLAAFGLFHLMIHKVNRELPNDDKIPHSLYWGRWKRLQKLYKDFYPRSSLYSLTLVLAAGGLMLAIAAATILWWQYAAGR